MTRALVALWTLLIVYGLLLFGDFILKAADQFRSHVQTRSENVEATDREIIRTGAWAVSGFVHQSSVLVLLRGSEASL